MIFRFKSFHQIEGKLFSWYDTDNEWLFGEWRKIEGEIKLCNNGFHACQTAEMIKNFTQYGVIAKVECRGFCDAVARQEAWSEMRVVELLGVF